MEQYCFAFSLKALVFLFLLLLQAAATEDAAVKEGNRISWQTLKPEALLDTDGLAQTVNASPNSLVSVHRFADNSVYEGEWERNMMHGRGKYTFASGTIYEGDFYMNKYHGRGIAIFLMDRFTLASL